MEFPGITVGGGFSGTAGESSGKPKVEPAGLRSIETRVDVQASNMASSIVL